jgi:hypothetical protein
MRKRRAESASGVDQEDERERTTAEVSKLVDDIRTEGWSCPWEKSWEIPVYCPDGVRRVGGVSLVRASARNAGTCRSGIVRLFLAGREGVLQVVKSHEELSTGYGAQGRTVS